MEYDQDKVDEITLALLWLTSFKDPDGVRVWKGQDWETMERLAVYEAVRTQTLDRTSNQGPVATHQIPVMEG